MVEESIKIQADVKDAVKKIADLTEAVKKLTEENKEQADQLNKTMKEVPKAAKKQEGAMKKLGIESKIVDDAVADANAAMKAMVMEADKAGKKASPMAVAFEGASVAAKGLGKALTDPLAILGFIVAAWQISVAC